MNRYAASLLILLPAIQGCSSSYEPARSPRIAVVAEGSGPVVVKDGQHYGSLMLGGVVDAAQGNARAEREARVGRNLAIGGLVFDLAGLGSTTAAIVVQAQRNRPSDPQPSAAATGLLIGGLVGVTVGTILLLSSPPHTYDAITIYNDSLDPPPPPAH
jgi:hypothetical protein